MIVIDFATPWASEPAEYIRKGLAVRDRYKAFSLISTTFAPHAPYSVSDSTLTRIRQLADEIDAPIHMHVHETAHEVESAIAETGHRPLHRLRELGLVRPGFMAVHATQLSAREIDELAEAGASVVHCPRSNLKLASGACPTAALHAAGVNVALGTDSAVSNNRLDIWSELQTAALFGKFVAGDASALAAATVLEMATLNGARALGLAEETGSLVPGKAADAVCVSLGDPALHPVLDPLSQLVYSASREQVTDVWIAGEHLLVDGRLARMATEQIIQRATEWGNRIVGS
jgi:5-methylthioadenosine/S-adenosylhomocysteine deaminase